MEKIKGFIFLSGAFMLAGTSVVAARYVSGVLGTFTIAAVSLLFALTALLIASRKHVMNTLRNMPVKDTFILILQALCGIFLFRMFLLKGLLYTSSGEAGILTGVTPAATVLLSKLFLKESICVKSILGILSTIAGIVLLQGFIGPEGFQARHLAGNLLVICAAICESLFNVLSRISSIRSTASSRKSPLNPLVQTTIVSGIAFILCIIPALYENPLPTLLSLGFREWFMLIWYGLFITALAFILWYAGIKRCNASTAAAFSGMMPFTALILSILFLGEQSGWRQWLGALLVIMGMVIIGINQQKSGIRHKYLASRTTKINNLR